MNGNRESRDAFPDTAGKKLENQQHNTIPPVKRPRQKGLQFDLADVQQQPRNDCPPDLSMQLHGRKPFANRGSQEAYVRSGYCQEMALPGGSTVGRWYPEFPPCPRRDTPVPDVEMEGAGPVEDPPLWTSPFPFLDAAAPVEEPSAMPHWLRKSMPSRQQRPLQPMERFVPRQPREEPAMMPGHVPFPVETLEDRMATSPFSAVRTERDRFMEMMNGSSVPTIFDPHPRPGMAVMPQPHARKLPSQAGGLFTGEGGYEDLSSGLRAGKDWGTHCKEAEAALAGQRLRQLRRSRAPGPNREPDFAGAYSARQNALFDFSYPSEATTERVQGRMPLMKERLRRVEHRQHPLDDNREQESRATMERHRARQQARERRAPCRGSEFGALMNVLGLVPDEDVPGNARDTSSGISRMREAVFGIVNSRLPPHLLFSDRDFDGDDYEFLCRLDDSVESKKGADDKIINKINLQSFGTGGLAPSTRAEPRCPICLENFAEGVEIRVMPCQHQYHRCCLDKWLKIKAVCPICSMNIKDKFLEDAEPDCI